MVKFCKPAAGAIVGFSLCFSPALASAAALPPAPLSGAPMLISPLVLLSAYGTMQSQSAVCAATVGAAGAAVAVAGQAPAAGCVLPVLDPAPPIAAEPGLIAPVAYAPIASSGFGFGLGALIAGLVLAGGLAAVLFSGNNNGDRPVSPD